MTLSEVLTGLVADAMAPILRRAVNPETTFASTGADIPPIHSHLPLATRRRHEAKAPLAPRDRLSARLSMLVALKECERQLMLDILRDVEAIEDAKKHSTVAGL